jgi:hypothetical protein
MFTVQVRALEKNHLRKPAVEPVSCVQYCAMHTLSVESGRTISADGWEEEDDVMFALVQVSCITSKHRGMHFVPGVGGGTSSRDRQTDRHRKGEWVINGTRRSEGKVYLAANRIAIHLKFCYSLQNHRYSLSNIPTIYRNISLLT